MCCGGDLFESVTLSSLLCSESPSISSFVLFNVLSDTLGAILAAKEASWVPKVYWSAFHLSSVANCETIWQQFTQPLKIISFSSEWHGFSGGKYATFVSESQSNICWNVTHFGKFDIFENNLKNVPNKVISLCLGFKLFIILS